MRTNILLDARAGHFAVGAFNVNTYDEMIAIADEAERRKLPVIMMASMSSAKFFGIPTFARLCHVLDEAYSVPVISHLDHCTQPDLLRACADAGFDSVMYDGSHGLYEDNVRVTRELADECHKKGVFIEAELGVIAGEEGPVKSKFSEFTNPDYVADFASRTHLDSLAVSIGNAHGFYKGKPEIRFGLLEEIRANIPDTPLVLHGGTGIPGEDIRRSIRMGITKVNVGTEIRAAYMNGLKVYAAAHAQDGDVREFVVSLRETVGRSAAKYMDCFDCRGDQT